MQYVRFGSTGIKVSRLCLGCMTYGSKKWREWVLEEHEGRPFIRRALELGINFFDTADMYSLGVSEEILGRALKDFGPGRDRVVVATKLFNPMGDDPNQRGLTRKHVRHSIETPSAASAPITWTSTRSTASTTRRRSRKRSKPSPTSS